jgi:hypothetical protein
MHKSATKCNETQGKWCKNKHGASKIIDTLETYHHGTMRQSLDFQRKVPEHVGGQIEDESCRRLPCREKSIWTTTLSEISDWTRRWPFIFNAIIESLDLREIALLGRKFTWANRCAIPTYEKLDRILVRVEVEQKFPLLSVRALTRSRSDHTPLLLDFGSLAHGGKKSTFSFELSWLR